MAVALGVQRRRCVCMFFCFFSSRRRHTRLQGDWSSDVCSSDLTTRIAKPPKKGEKPKSALQDARDRIAEMDRAAILAFKAPGKMSQLKSRLFAMLPYHRQAWSAGTLFNGVLQEPLTGLAPSPIEAWADHPAVAESEAQE